MSEYTYEYVIYDSAITIERFKNGHTDGVEDYPRGSMVSGLIHQIEEHHKDNNLHGYNLVKKLNKAEAENTLLKEQLAVLNLIFEEEVISKYIPQYRDERRALLIERAKQSLKGGQE